jgi:hypothetical protein
LREGGFAAHARAAIDYQNSKRSPIRKEKLVTWPQVYDLFNIWWLSTLVAALSIIVLFTLLAGLKVRPHLCAIAGAVTAVLVGIIVFKVPLILAGMSFAFGVAFGVPKIAWIVLAAIVGLIVMMYAYVFPHAIPHGLSFVR